MSVRGSDTPSRARSGATNCGEPSTVPGPARRNRADVVLSINSARHALEVLNQGLPGCAPGTIWADLNTAAPALKRAIADVAGDRLLVVDVAVMGAVPPRGLHTRPGVPRPWGCPGTIVLQNPGVHIGRTGRSAVGSSPASASVCMCRAIDGMEPKNPSASSIDIASTSPMLRPR